MIQLDSPNQRLQRFAAQVDIAPIETRSRRGSFRFTELINPTS